LPYAGVPHAGLRPKLGDFLFYSYSSMKCPPIQERR